MEQVYAKLGMVDQTHRVLDQAIEAGFLCLPAFKNDPYLEALRGTTRWNELIDRVTVKQQLVRAEGVSGLKLS